MINIYNLHSKPEQLVGYAEATEKIPSLAWEKYMNRPAELAKREHLWAQYASFAYYYASRLNVYRWLPGEAAIAQSPKYATLYCRDVIHQRMPEAEPVIAESAWWSVLYARTIIKGRWPEAEPVIAKDADRAYEYARYVLRGRFKLAEPAIIKEPGTKEAYRERFYVDDDDWAV